MILGVILAVVYHKMPEPTIEIPMIKQFAMRPKGLTADQYKDLQWLNTKPFPLKELVYNNTITIDKAHKIETIIIEPLTIPC
tara:strand:+ start:241 stop:486 length:246 start_codon:yes stop_codon:yes gene_type:complete